MIGMRVPEHTTASVSCCMSVQCMCPESVSHCAGLHVRHAGWLRGPGSVVGVPLLRGAVWLRGVPVSGVPVFAMEVLSGDGLREVLGRPVCDASVTGVCMH